MKQITLNLKTNLYPIEVLRYALYTLTNDYWVLIQKKDKNNIEVILTAKESIVLDKKKLEKRIEEEIKDELFRYKLMSENLMFRENIIKKAIHFNPPQEEPQDYALTPEEQKELERIIKEAEEEIKKELKKEKKNDISKTWEEKYGKKGK